MKYLKKLWKESFKEFYKKYSRALWFYIYKTCGDESMADDVFQETFYRYLRAEPVRLNEYQQKAYLYKVAYRLIIDQKRKQKTEREKPSEAGFEIKDAIHPIVPIMLGDAVLSQKMAAKLLEKGVYVIGFFFPVVPKGTARIRVQISAAHSKEDLDFAIEKFTEVKREMRI